MVAGVGINDLGGRRSQAGGVSASGIGQLEMDIRYSIGGPNRLFSDHGAFVYQGVCIFL